MKRKTKIIILMAVMLFVLVFSASLASTFTDTTGDNAKYETAANELVELGIICAYPDGSIGVDMEIIRAEFAKILVTTMRKNEEADNYNDYLNLSDVSDNHWARGYIGVAIDNGYLTAYPNGTFLPEETITNFEMIRCFINLLRYEVVTNDETNITEATMNKAKDLGLLEGVSDLVAEDKTTRGDLILVLWNALNIKVNGTEKTLLGMNFSYDIIGTLESVEKEVREIDGQPTEVYIFVIDGITYIVKDTENFIMAREGKNKYIGVTIEELLEDEENNSYLGQRCTLERSDDDASPISLYFGKISMKHAGQFFLVSDGVYRTSEGYSINLYDTYGDEYNYQFDKNIEYPTEIDEEEYDSENPKFVFIEFDENDEIASINLVKYGEFYYAGEDSVRYEAIKITGKPNEDTLTIPTISGEIRIPSRVKSLMVTPVLFDGKFDSIRVEYGEGSDSLFDLNIQEGSFALSDCSRKTERADLIYVINESCEYEIRYGVIEDVRENLLGEYEIEIDGYSYSLSHKGIIEVGDIVGYVELSEEIEILDVIKPKDLDYAKVIVDFDASIIELKDGTFVDTDCEDYQDYKVVVIETEKANIGELVEFVSVDVLADMGLSAIDKHVGDRIIIENRNKLIIYFKGLGEDDFIKDGYLVEEPNKTVVELNLFIENGIDASWVAGEYTGTDKDMSIKAKQDMDESIVSISGDLTGKEPGEYTIWFKLKDKANYVWDLLDDEHKYTSEDIAIKWKILKNNNGIYSPSQRVLKTFTGNEIEIDPEEVYLNESRTKKLTDYIDLGEFNISGNKATLPGDYEMLLKVKEPEHFELLKYYADPDHAEDEIGVPYTIEKISDTINVPTQRILKTYTGEPVEITIDEILMDARLNGSYLHLTDFITEEYYEIENANNLEVEPGDYTFRVKLTDEGKKYVQLGDGTKDYIDIDYTIQKVRYGFYSKSQRFLREATGEDIDITKSGAFRPRDEHMSFFEITGNIQKEPGKYVATIKIIDTDHCEFSMYGSIFDNLFDTLTIDWEIVDAIKYGVVVSANKSEKQIELSNEEKYYLADGYDPLYLIGKPIAFKVQDDGKIVIEQEIYEAILDEANIISSSTDDETIRFTNNSIIGRDWNSDYYNRNIIEIGVKKINDGKYFKFESIEYKGVGVANIKNEAGVRVLRGDSYKDGNYPYYFVFVGLDEDERTKDGQIFKTEKEIVESIDLYSWEYTGKEKNIEDFAEFNEALYTVTGTLKATEPGRYDIVLSLKDKNKYAWNQYEDDNGLTPTSEDQTVYWEIRKVHNYIYAPSQRVLKTCTGEEQEVTFEELSFNGHVDKRWFDITGNKATEVGTYEMKLTLNDTAHAMLNKYYDNQEEKNVIIIEWEIQSCVAHDLEKIARVEATTTKTGNIEHYKCKVCEKLFSDDKATKEIKESDTIIPKKSSSGGTGGGGGSSSPAVKTYTTSVTSKSTQGTVTLDPKKVEKGESQKIVITPKEGYKVSDVKINGKSVGAVLEYTIKDVEKNNTIEVVYEKITEAEINSGDNKEPVVTPPDETNKIKEFKDVKDGDWYKDSVNYVYEKGLFKGTSDDEFSPNSTMNRAMLVTVLYRLAGESKTVSESNKFEDIEAGSYYAEAVNWAVENGIINGVNSNIFGANMNISREQLVTILYRYAKLLNKVSEKSNNTLSKYDDKSEISSYAEEAFDWAVSEGIINGRTATTLSPKGTCSRAEVATMIMRFAEKIK